MWNVKDCKGVSQLLHIHNMIFLSVVLDTWVYLQHIFPSESGRPITPGWFGTSLWREPVGQNRSQLSGLCSQESCEALLWMLVNCEGVYIIIILCIYIYILYTLNKIIFADLPRLPVVWRCNENTYVYIYLQCTLSEIIWNRSIYNCPFPSRSWSLTLRNVKGNKSPHLFTFQCRRHCRLASLSYQRSFRIFVPAKLEKGTTSVVLNWYLFVILKVCFFFKRLFHSFCMTFQTFKHPSTAKSAFFPHLLFLALADQGAVSLTWT